ncbi:hypothetical protein NliqN6_2714 [Naganishia liquefaciens]|uniref:DUF1772 domain-containing protein n=1 Tax=Naganishia liquefaciens TaxID=104408 RepID=A0A8H3TSC5_9TREE|nr:hypothetical protein NliqN6_2714 [Naganishia liquefaciens]
MSSNNLSQTRLLQSAGIACSGALTGYISLFSVIDRFALLESPTTETAKVWQRMYNVGKSSAPPMAIVTSGIFGYLAYQAPTKDLAQLYTATAVLLPLIAPYTLTLMKSTNNALHLTADKGTTESSRIRELLDSWWKLNAGRAALTGLATVLAIWASSLPTTILPPFKA